MNAAIELDDGSVHLRPTRAADVDVLYPRTSASPEPDGAVPKDTLDGVTPEWSNRIGLAVEVDGVVVGEVEARSPHGHFPPGVCEIAIELLPQWRGRGVGTAAIGLLTEHLLSTGWQRIQAATGLTNQAMRAVLEHVGYRYEGVLRGYAPGAEGREDYVSYAVLSEGVSL